MKSSSKYPRVGSLSQCPFPSNQTKFPPLKNQYQWKLGTFPNAGLKATLRSQEYLFVAINFKTDVIIQTQTEYN